MRQKTTFWRKLKNVDFYPYYHISKCSVFSCQETTSTRSRRPLSTVTVDRLEIGCSRAGPGPSCFTTGRNRLLGGPPGGSLLARKNIAFTRVLLLQELDVSSTVVDRCRPSAAWRPPGGSHLTRKNTALTLILLLQEIAFLEFRGFIG